MTGYNRRAKVKRIGLLHAVAAKSLERRAQGGRDHAAEPEGERVAAQLAEKARLQRLLAELSGRFVALPSSCVGVAIEEAQKMIVRTFDLDRCSLWQSLEEGSSFVLAENWQRPGWPALPSRFSVTEELPWVHAKLLGCEAVRFSSVRELPAEASRDVATFQRYGVQSNITIPLVAGGKAFGALAFSMLSAEREWHDDEIIALKLVAQIISNVVARQRAELREEQVRSELAHAMRIASLGELAAALAHELNQPLAAILTNAQAARRFLDQGSMSGGELRTILDDIIRDDKRAGGVIHSLRRMASKHPADREDCCMNDLVQEVIELMKGELLGEHIEVHCYLATVLPRVEGVRVELQQVLVNLLVNGVQAMKATAPDQRYIDVATVSGAGYVLITICDRGHGIPVDRLPNVFSPFVTTKDGGLGVGLSICRRIVESHSGRIEVNNRADCTGARFVISLPAK